ncbi:MAG TPA: dihydroxyacetone kinase subunit DhaL, partial [Actinomycetota bacterium]|nr:dihydroxyacetone kinase subunit DhaL [Actinomycetota bacterium]
GAGARLDAAFVRRWMGSFAELIAASRDHLTQLDAAIGDADHGVNMDRGMRAAMAELASLDGASPGRILHAVGRTLILTVGGAAGPLYGTALRRAGAALGEAPAFGPEELLDCLRAALDGIQRLGAAAEGDKTIVDAFSPALGALRRGLRGRGGLPAALHAARAAAEEGARATIPMQARKGRASYLGTRSIGHQDPGATSTALLFEALERAAEAGPLEPVGRDGSVP